MRLLHALLIVMGMVFSNVVQSQSWPERTVRLIVPFPPGGGTDTSARLLAEKLAAVWKQPVVVENVPGAAGSVGAARVARSPADGYSLLFAPSGVLTANPHLYPNAGYETLKDFTPVSVVASGPMLLVVPASSPYRTLGELIAAAKAQPGKLTHGHAGVGSQVQLVAENFIHAAGLEIVPVPYKGEVPALAGLLSAETTFSVGNFAAAIGHVSGGRLRALAVTGKEPSPQLAEVPPIARTLPGFEAYGWFGIVAPRGTPVAVIDTIYKETRKAVDATDLKARLYVQGMSPVASSPQAMAKTIEADSAQWSRVIKERGIKVQ